MKTVSSLSTALALTIALLLSACPGGSAQEMLETAQLEEVQDNLENARKIYQRIIEQYPDSAPADEARARLAALQE